MYLFGRYMKVINVFFVAEGHKDQTAEKSVISCQKDWSSILMQANLHTVTSDDSLLKKPDHNQSPTKCKNSNNINLEKYLSSILLGIEYHKERKKKKKQICKNSKVKCRKSNNK